MTGALLSIILLGLVSTHAVAQFGPTLPGSRQPTGDSLVAVEVVAPSRAIAANERFELAVVFRIEPKWHIYWVNAGSGGLPTSIRATTPEGFVVGDIRWPTPQSFLGEEGTSYGYESGVALFLPITAPETLPEGPITFELAIEWLVCKTICLTGSAKRTVTLDQTSTANDSTPLVRSIVERSRRTVPQPLEELDGADVVVLEDHIRIEGPLESADAAADAAAIRFFPLESPAITTGASKVERRGERFVLTVPITIRPENSLGEPMTIGGVVALPNGRSYEFIHEVEAK